MTPAEFKAWFDGFTEGMDGPPSAKQWKKITDKVKTIDGRSALTPVYVERIARRDLPQWLFEPRVTLDSGGTGDAPSWVKNPIVCSSAGAVSSSTVRLSAADLKAQQFTPTASALLMAEGRADALAAA